MDSVALASVITSGLVGIGGLALTAWNAERERGARREEREADAHFELVRRGGEVIGPFLTLLPTVHPDRVAFNARPESYAELDRARERFRSYATRLPLLRSRTRRRRCSVWLVASM
jgi:hypothetical protein